jgi:hypothetical protein
MTMPAPHGPRFTGLIDDVGRITGVMSTDAGRESSASSAATPTSRRARASR